MRNGLLLSARVRYSTFAGQLGATHILRYEDAADALSGRLESERRGRSARIIPEGAGTREGRRRDKSSEPNHGARLESGGFNLKFV
jgi:hypothetical protein